MKMTISRAHVRIFRAVEGAVINTAHGHPRWNLTNVMAQSIAKRATGTLTAAWPDVLAARSMPSDRASDPVHGRWPPLSRGSGQTARRGASRGSRRSPLGKLWKMLAIKVGEAKRSGQVERAETLIEVLKAVAQMQRASVVQ